MIYQDDPLRDKDYLDLVRALRAIGVTSEIPRSADWPVFEGDYLKMMMGEPYEALACDGVEDWLKANGWSYERHRDRAIRKIDPRAVAEICRLWGLDPEEFDEIDPDHEIGKPWSAPCVSEGVPRES